MKPDFYQILNTDSSRATADLAAEAVAGVPEYFEEVLHYSFIEKSPVNWRAARVVWLCSTKFPELFKPHANKTAKLFSEFKVDGLKRTYAYMLSNYVNELDEDSLADMIDICFKYMLNDEKIAVKYNCMKFLYETCKLIPELSGELLAVIEVNISDGTFRFNGLLKKIYTEIELKIQ